MVLFSRLLQSIDLAFNGFSPGNEDFETVELGIGDLENERLGPGGAVRDRDPEPVRYIGEAEAEGGGIGNSPRIRR